VNNQVAVVCNVVVVVVVVVVVNSLTLSLKTQVTLNDSVSD
jgi:hypothetical protein